MLRNVGGHTRCPDIAHLWQLRDCRASLEYSIVSTEGAEKIIVRPIQAWCLKPMLHISNMHCVIQLERKHGVIYIINGLRLIFFKCVLMYFVSLFSRC